MMRAFLVVMFAAMTMAFGFGGASAQDEVTEPYVEEPITECMVGSGCHPDDEIEPVGTTDPETVMVDPLWTMQDPEPTCDTSVYGASGCDDTTPGICVEAGVPCQEEETPTTDEGEIVSTTQTGVDCPECPNVPDLFDVGCMGFPSQADAQAAYDAGGLVDIQKIDPDLNGIACDHEDRIDGPPATDTPPECGMFPDPDDAQNALDSGAGDPAVFDPDGDGIACNHDDETTTVPTEDTDDDGATVATTTEPETTEVDAVEPSTDDGDTDAPAEVPATTGGETADDDTDGNESVELPRTGVGITDDRNVAVLSILLGGIILLGGAGVALRRRT